MDNLIRFVEAMGFWGWIAVIVIGACVVEAVVVMRKMQIKHEERMAKISAGIDPGDETEAYKKDSV
jgi:hypothetical protein